jgi:hypothetical protein
MYIYVCKVMAFLPPKVFNSYVYMDSNKKAIAAPDSEKDKGYWNPGDFLVHFAGKKVQI